METALFWLMATVIFALLLALAFVVYSYVALVRKFTNYMVIEKFQSLETAQERREMKLGVDLAKEVEGLDKLANEPPPIPTTQKPPAKIIKQTHSLS